MKKNKKYRFSPTTNSTYFWDVVDFPNTSLKDYVPSVLVSDTEVPALSLVASGCV